MWLAQLNAVLWTERFMLPAPMIWCLVYLRQRFVHRCHGRKDAQQAADGGGGDSEDVGKLNAATGTPAASRLFCPKYPATAARRNYDMISIPLFPRSEGSGQLGVWSFGDPSVRRLD
jgi:hypothetical protein